MGAAHVDTHYYHTRTDFPDEEGACSGDHTLRCRPYKLPR
jgi:hypothetical protein